MTTHNDRILIQIALDAPAIVGSNFTTAILLSSTSTLGGDTVRSYTSTAQLTADVTAGELSAAAKAACVAALSNDRVKMVKVGAVSAYTSAQLDAVIAADPSFYGIAIESRLEADVVAISTAVQAMARIFAFQTSDADAKTAGLPAGLTVGNDEHAGGVVHDDDAVAADFAWIARCLAVDPQVTSAPWHRALSGIDAAAGVTEGERDLIRANNLNVPLPFFSNAVWMDPGVNCKGRPMHEVVTKHWLTETMQNRIAATAARFSALDQKWPLNRQGQHTLAGIVETTLQQAQTVGHIDPGQYVVERPAITDADRAAARLVVNFTATLLGATRSFSVVGGLVNSPVIVEV